MLAAVVLSQMGFSSAHAEDGPTVVFDEPTTVSVEYGQFWQFHAVGRPTAVGYGETYSGRATLHGGPSSYELSTYAYYHAPPDAKTTIDIYPSSEQTALTVGTYTIDATVTLAYFTTGDYATSTTPATLVVEPAALGIDLRVLADLSNPTGAIVNAKFTGRFVDEYQSSFFPGSALSPAGEWHITITDEDGEIALQRNIERAAGDDTLGTSFYWTSAEPGAEYSATAEFEPSGASAANFAIAPATAFSYTAQPDPRPVPTSTATAKPATHLAEPAGFALPLWSLLLSGLLIAGLGALVTVFSLRLRRGLNLSGDREAIS